MLSPFVRVVCDAGHGRAGAGHSRAPRRPLVPTAGPVRFLCADGSDARVVAQVLYPVRSLPGEFRLAPAEVAVGGRLLVDGAAQVEVFDDAGGGGVEVAGGHFPRAWPGGPSPGAGVDPSCD